MPKDPTAISIAHRGQRAQPCRRREGSHRPKGLASLLGVSPQQVTPSRLTIRSTLYHAAHKAKHIAARVAELPRKRRMISYPIGVTPDPEELLLQLRECRDSPYGIEVSVTSVEWSCSKGAEAELESTTVTPRKVRLGRWGSDACSRPG